MQASNIDQALHGYTSRIVELHEQREALNGDIREVYAEAKEAGFDVTTVREIVREFRMEPDARAARYQLLNEYRAALGMLDGTPLGDAAMRDAEPEPPPGRRRGRPRRADNIRNLDDVQGSA